MLFCPNYEARWRCNTAADSQFSCPRLFGPINFSGGLEVDCWWSIYQLKNAFHLFYISIKLFRMGPSINRCLYGLLCNTFEDIRSRLSRVKGCQTDNSTVTATTKWHNNDPVWLTGSACTGCANGCEGRHTILCTGHADFSSTSRCMDIWN